MKRGRLRKHSKSYFYIAIILLGLFLISLLFNSFFDFFSEIFIKVFFCIVILFNVFVLFFIESKGIQKIVKKLFFSFLVLLAIGSIIFQYSDFFNSIVAYIGNSFLSDFPLIFILAKILEFISANLFYICVFCIATGLLTFYYNKEILKNIQKENRKQKIKENRRKENFSDKYPRLNSIPILRHLFKWMYKEGWVYSISLIVIVLIGFVLRFTNLGLLPPYTDEYAHLINAKNFLSGEAIEYTRTISLTFLTAISFKIFGVSIIAGRLPVVIFNSLTAIPLYFIGRKINKSFGLILGFLYMISPWAIATSRNLREYGFFSLFIALTILLLMEFYLYIDKNLNKDKKYFFSKKFFVYLVLFFVPLMYSFLINFKSTFKIVSIYYLVFGIFVLISIIKNKKLKKKKWKNLAFVILPLIIILFFKDKIYKSLKLFAGLPPDFNETWWNYTLFQPMWFNIDYIYFLLAFLGIVLCLFYIINKKYYQFKISSFLISLFMSSLLFFVFFFERYDRPRYAFPNLLVYCFLIGLGIYFIVKIMPYLWNNRKKILLFSVIFLLVILNFPMVFDSFNLSGGGYVPITHEHHDEVRPVIEKYGKNLTKEDSPIICSLCFFDFYINVSDERYKHYSYKNKERFNNTYKVIKENERGWMILDWRRNNYWTEGFPKKDFVIDNKTVRFLEMKSGFYIYRWD